MGGPEGIVFYYCASHVTEGVAMPGKNVSYVDKKGRLLIPQRLRDALHLKEGEKVILDLDESRRTITIEPSYERKLLKLDIALGDSPGALAKAAASLARLGVDLVSTQSHSAMRGEAAIWEVECNPGDVAMPAVRSALRRSGARVVSAKWD